MSTQSHYTASAQNTLPTAQCVSVYVWWFWWFCGFGGVGGGSGGSGSSGGGGCGGGVFPSFASLFLQICQVLISVSDGWVSDCPSHGAAVSNRPNVPL